MVLNHPASLSPSAKGNGESSASPESSGDGWFEVVQEEMGALLSLLEEMALLPCTQKAEGLRGKAVSACLRAVRLKKPSKFCIQGTAR